MLRTGGRHRFSMPCTLISDGRYFFNHTAIVDTTGFLNHIGIVYKKVGKMVLFADRAPWHTSDDDAIKFFKERDIVLVWYPVGHPYLNPVEEIWSVLKRSIDHSIRYADRTTHLNAVFEFIRGHKFDYDFWAY